MYTEKTLMYVKNSKIIDLFYINIINSIIIGLFLWLYNKYLENISLINYNINFDLYKNRLL